MVRELNAIANRRSQKLSTATDNMQIRHGLAISFYHIPSNREVSFKSMITSHTEQFSPEWKKEKIYGRQDPIGNFQGTQRTFSIGFDVPGESKRECVENMGKVGLLAAMTYPSYDITRSDPETTEATHGIISAAPLMRIKFTNLIANSHIDAQFASAKRGGLLGMLENLNITYDQENSYIQLIQGTLTPKIYNISFNFTVIHEHPVGWGVYDERGTTDFLLVDHSQEEFVPTSNYPYGVSHIESDSDQFDADQRANVFRRPNSYAITGREKFINKVDNRELNNNQSKYIDEVSRRKLGFE